MDERGAGDAKRSGDGGFRLKPASGDARYRRVRVCYPHNPYFGEELVLVREMPLPAGVQYEVIAGGIQMLLPCWMFDEEFCRSLSMGDPQCTVAGYLALAAELEVER